MLKVILMRGIYKKSQDKYLVAMLTAAIMLLIPIAALAADLPALVTKTGLTYLYATGEDRDCQTGVASPNPRFADNIPKTVFCLQFSGFVLKNQISH